MTRLLTAALQRLRLYGPLRDAARAVLRFLPSARRQRLRLEAFYAELIRPGDLCFDVGANAGDRTEVFLRLGARVVAVEPQERCLRRLRRRFGRDPRVRLVPQALGAAAGEAELRACEADTISSLSTEWISRVSASGRFSGFRWDRPVKVPVTTLDALVREHGRPHFCKIDVEGFEFQVLQGLTQPLEVLSFEFTPEYPEATSACVRRLAELGPVRFNYSLGESMELSLADWVGPEEICGRLVALPDPMVFGDVYARFEAR